LGILLFELFHKAPPFRIKKVNEFLNVVKKRNIVYKRGINKKIVSLIERIL